VPHPVVPSFLKHNHNVLCRLKKYLNIPAPSPSLNNTQQSEVLGMRSAQRLLLRCFPLNISEMRKGKAAKPPRYPPHCWPLETTLRINSVAVPIKQRQVRLRPQMPPCPPASGPPPDRREPRPFS
jgi:hypothetical protein